MQVNVLPPLSNRRGLKSVTLAVFDSKVGGFAQRHRLTVGNMGTGCDLCACPYHVGVCIALGFELLRAPRADRIAIIDQPTDLPAGQDSLSKRGHAPLHCGKSGNEWEHMIREMPIASCFLRYRSHVYTL